MTTSGPKKFKLPSKIGEGDRVRRPSKYGEGGRDVGGNARRHALKAKVSAPVTAPKKSTVRPAPIDDDSVLVTEDDLPSPGGHPSFLTKRAHAAGKSLPNENNPFAKLKALGMGGGIDLDAKAAEEQAEPGAGAPDYMDSSFTNPVEIERPTRTRAHEVQKLEKARLRLPILRRPTRAIRATETDGGSDGEAHAAGGTDGDHARRGGGAGGGKEGEADGSREAGGGLLAQPAHDPRQLSLFAADVIDGQPPTHSDRADQKTDTRAQVEDAPGDTPIDTLTVGDATGDTGMAPQPATPQSPGASVPAALAKVPEDEGDHTPYTEQQEIDVASLMAMPGVVCNNCPAAESCPQYQPNNACYYDEDFGALSSRSIMNLLPTMEVIADIQKRRAMRAVMLESRVAGGQLDPNVTRQLEIAALAAERVARLKTPTVQAATKSIAVISQNPKQASGGGLLAKLLSGVTGTSQPQAGEIVLHAEPAQEETVAVVVQETVPMLPQGGGGGGAPDNT